MKKLIPFLSLLIFAACGENGSAENTESENILEKLSYTVDTVVVNPGEEIIDLSGGLRLSSLSEDKKKLFVFTQKEHHIAVIDLEELELLEFLPFEVEGPNGIGQYIGSMQPLEGEKFLMSSFQSSGIFDRTGIKVQDIKLKQEDFKGVDTEDESPLNHKLIQSSDAKWLFSLPGDFLKGVRDLAMLDPIEKSGKIIDIPAMDKASDFRIILQSDKMMSVYIEDINLQEIGGKIYISNSATSDIYQYDYQLDSLKLYQFPHQLVPPAKTGNVKNTVTSQEEWRSEMEKLSNQTGFEKLLWDESINQFFRFGRKHLPKANEDDPARAEVYLFAYNPELELIGEKLLDRLNQVPSYAFFKGGKLWSYVNVEDELGFAVFTFDF